MIVYIHGAHMTSAAFNYIKTKLPRHEQYNIEYDALGNLEETVERINSELANLKKPFKIISHSLGGVLALCVLSSGLPVEKIITIGSPLGGVNLQAVRLNSYFIPLITNFMPDEAARFLKFTNQISADSKVFRDLHKSDIDTSKIFSIVTNMGKVFSAEDSDMVVTVKSQKHFDDVRYEELNCSHGESLLRPETINIIKRELKL